DGGLHVVDPDSGSVELLAAYPEGIYGRANDANADPAGNIVTGTLNIGPGPGAYWWFSSAKGWRKIDEDTGNANGPVVVVGDDGTNLFFADTNAAAVYVYAYEPTDGVVGPRRVAADYSHIGGAPDGATSDDRGSVWACVLRAGKLAKFTATGGIEEL